VGNLARRPPIAPSSVAITSLIGYAASSSVTTCSTKGNGSFSAWATASCTPPTEEWGVGSVVEVMTSVVPGGTCIVRILFEDGQQRTFINDMDSELCCCYLGVRKEWRFDFGDVHRVFRGGSRRRLTSR
jgi:hypothetical protein